MAASAFIWKLMHQKMETDRKFNVKKMDNKFTGVMKARHSIVRQLKLADKEKAGKEMKTGKNSKRKKGTLNLDVYRPDAQYNSIN